MDANQFKLVPLIDLFAQGSLAKLHAKNHKVSHVVFAGSFLRRNPISSAFRISTTIFVFHSPMPTHSSTVARLTYAFEYWSKGTMNAVFLRHEGYLGAIGALLYGELTEKHPVML